MNVTQAMQERRSVRHFLSRLVDGQPGYYSLVLPCVVDVVLTAYFDNLRERTPDDVPF